MTAQTLFGKVWTEHLVTARPGFPDLIYIDLHLVHEVTSPQAFAGLRRRKLPVRRPDLTLATVDHSIPTAGRRLPIADSVAAGQVEQLESNCRAFSIPFYGPGHPRQGIVHVIAPELGLTQPGMTIVCGDSHTSTHGAFGALAFGIGTTEIERVLATQSLLLRRPKAYRVTIDGTLSKGVTAKDVILALINQMGVSGGNGAVLEYSGSAIRALSMEERMTVCNMSIELGARAGMVAPDETTFQYVAGLPFAPKGQAWETALDRWNRFPSDPGAGFDREFQLDVSRLEPMITFGTHPGTGISIGAPIPTTPQSEIGRSQALDYMQLAPGKPLLGHHIDVVFVGSCTNSRITDLRQAAEVLKGRRVADSVRMLVVPGSESVKRQAESEKLDEVFLQAGAEWRQAGCSMCIAMNGDQVEAGQYCISTSNRNFEGRQGRGSRTFLASPLTAAASAVRGRITDPRTFF